MHVIYLNTNKNVEEFFDNNYGYWTGKHYMVQGEYYPITVRNITEKVKKYKNRKVAESSAEKCFERYSYVISTKVEEIDI